MSEPRKHDLRPFLPQECDLKAFDWPLEKKAYGLLWALLPFCLFWWWIDKREPDYLSKEDEMDWNYRRANFVLGWTVVLVVLWLFNPHTGPWAVIVGIIAALRLLEVFVSGLGTILDQRQQIRARNVVTILIYAVQVTFIFAILYHSFAEKGFQGKEEAGPVQGGTTTSGNYPTQSSDYLYISWSAVVSLGNEEFEPTTTPARFLEVATTTAGIFLLAVLLAYAIDMVKKDKQRARGSSCDRGPPPLAPLPVSASRLREPDEPVPFPRLALLLECLEKWRSLKRPNDERPR